jgi:hypothetical protein
MRGLPSFAVSKADAALITRIAERAVSVAERYGHRTELLGVCANLMACHANGCPLRLDALLAANDAAFIREVWGIGRHLDRTTGTPAGRFEPRFAAPPHEQDVAGESVSTSTGLTARERRNGGGERASAGMGGRQGADPESRPAASEIFDESEAA